MGKELSFNDINMLKDIFARQNWPIEQKETNSKFNQFCSMLKYFSDDQKALVLRLTSNFMHFELSSFTMHIINALDAFQYFFFRSNKLFILPLLKDPGSLNAQSSYFIYYLMRDVALKYNAKYAKIRKVFLERYDKLKDAKIGSNDFIVLVDDFIGTGETANSAISVLKRKYKIKLKQIIVLVLAAQQAGIINIWKKRTVFAFSSVVRNKGITDCFDWGEVYDSKNVMLNMEKYVKIPEKYSLGYGSSEALISLIRSPNNTFPIYWYRNKQKKYFPPFDRY